MPEMIVTRHVWFVVDGIDMMLPVRSSETKTEVFFNGAWQQLRVHPLPPGEDTVLRINFLKRGKGRA